MPKLRVDMLLLNRGLAETREQAQRLVQAGRVSSGTLTFVKPSQMVSADAELSVSEPERYVSRGGLKLEGALAAFGVDPSGLRCMDLGASTGGFTDCLLQHGAASVLAVDVGRAQLHQRLREDPRVTLLEGTNARDLPELRIANFELRQGNGVALSGTDDAGDELRISHFELRQANGGGASSGTDDRQGEIRNSSFATPQLFVADLSFISLRKVLPSVARRLAAGTPGIVLLKPQFEAGPKDVPRGGVIKDEAVLERVRSEFVSWLEGAGWAVRGVMESPIRGGEGNVEYLVWLATPESA